MKRSIQWAVLLGLSIHVVNATAAEHQYYKPFQGWAGTPLVEVTRPEGTYQFRTLQRYALADVDPFLIGSLTYIKAPKTGVAKEQSTKLVLETLRKQLGAKGWQVRHKGSATIYETYWAKANRGVRIYLKENDREIDYSIAVYRPAFADTVAAEAELMQQQLAGVLDQKLPWLEKLMAKLESSLGIQSAFAVTDPCGCLNYSGSDRNACLATCPFPTDLGTTTPITTTPPPADTTPTPTTTTPPPATTTLPPINVDISSAVGTLTADPKIDGTLTDVRDTANTVKQSFKKFERLVDPEYLIAGTVAVLSTGFVMGAITSGITALGDSLVEFITGARDSKKRFEAFGQAMDEYKKLEDLQPDLEKEIDRQLQFLKLATEEAGGSENLLYFVRFNILREKAKQKNFQKKIDQALEANVSPTDGCLVDSFSAQAKIENNLAKLEAIAKNLTEADAIPSVCSKVEKQLRKMSEMEGQMQLFHSNLLNGIDVWVKQSDKEFQKLIENSDDYEKRLLKARKLEEKGVKKAAKMLDKRLRGDMAQAYSECMSEQAPFWSWVPGLGHLFTSDERKFCRELIKSPKSDIGSHFLARAKDIKEGVEAAELDKVGKDGKIEKEGVLSILARKAHAGDMRPGLTMKSMSYADQKRWILGVAKDHSVENLGKALREKNSTFQKYCSPGKR